MDKQGLKHKESNRRWYLANAERERERNRVYRLKFPERIKETNRKYREKNREKIRISNREWQKRNAEQNKKIQKNCSLKRQYGITLNDYNLLLESQNYKCAICLTDKSENGKSFAVDHNHKNGKIRGLLCENCNRGLGMFMDSENILLKAMVYLKNNVN